MKRIVALLLLICLGATLFGCAREAGELRFYVIPAGAYHQNQTAEELLAIAKEKGRTAFTDENLDGVVWQDQAFQMKELNVLGGYQDGGSAILQAGAEDAFVLALGNRVIYAGGFQPKAGAAPVMNPYIADESAAVFTIKFDEKYGTGDPRWNEALYQYLADRRLLVSDLHQTEE